MEWEAKTCAGGNSSAGGTSLTTPLSRREREELAIHTLRPRGRWTKHPSPSGRGAGVRVSLFPTVFALTYRLLSAASANSFSFSMRAANFFGLSDCGPSEEARSGSGCTSMMRPSAPAATAAKDIGAM